MGEQANTEQTGHAGEPKPGPDDRAAGRLHVPGRRSLDAATAAQAQLLAEYLDTEPAEVPDPLRPIAALREVAAVCDSIESGREGPQPNDRRSLRRDVERAIGDIGPDLRAELQPALRDYAETELRDLPELLDDLPGVVRLRAATRALLGRLRRPASSQAAWRDLLRSVQTGDPFEVCRRRALQLREIEESLGHEWLWRGKRLRELAGAGSFSDCEEVLSFPPPQSARVAWFIFASADVPEDYLRVGQVQFFSHRVWPDAVTDEGWISQFPDAEFPAEIDAHAIEQIKPRDRAAAHVYARVELTGQRAGDGRNPAAHGKPPGEWARELVTGIVEAGTFRVGGSMWKLLEGEALYHGQISDESGTFGNWSSHGDFEDPDELEAVRRYRPPLREGTGEALEELPQAFAELLAKGDLAAQQALAEVRWYESARRQPDAAQRVMLHVRAFERALPVSSKLRWSDATRRYFREFWALEQFESVLFGLAHWAEYALSHHRPAELDRLEQWLVRDGERFSVALGAFLRVAPKLEALLPASPRLQRLRVRQASRWAGDASRTRKHIETLEERFDALLARALRQRNATVHGLITVPEVLATVDRFVAQLAAFTVAQIVDSAASQEDVVDGLERGRVQSRRVLWRLDNEPGPVDRLLYRPETENE